MTKARPGSATVRWAFLALLLGAFVVLSLLGLYYARARGIDLRILSLTTEDVRSITEAWAPWSALASIALMILHSFLPLPAEVIAIANGMMFGNVAGVTITWIGAMLGAVLSFAISRHLGRPVARRLVAERYWMSLENWEPRTRTLLLARLIPVISFNLINFGAGLARVGWWTFLWTTGVGILPLTIVSVGAGDRVLDASPAEVGVVLAIAAILWFAFHRGIPQRVVNGLNHRSPLRYETIPLESPEGTAMKNSVKLRAGVELPQMRLPSIDGGEVQISGNGGWQMLVVYRGKHCPLCRKYLKTLDSLVDEFRAIGTRVIAASGDTKEKAESEATEEGWRFPVVYGMTPDQMRTLGLYISEPRSPQETDRPFPEPGLFVVNPDGLIQIVDVSNAPFSRPDLANILSGLKLIMDKNYPIRGTME